MRPLLLAILFTAHLAASTGAAPAHLPTVLTRIPLRNPQMTDGTNQPEHWTQTWIGQGKIKVLRDTATYHSAPASLALEAMDGAAQAQVSQSFEVKGGVRIQLSGWVRADGGANAMLALQSFTADWQGIDFQVVGNAITGLDWRKAEGEITVPTNAARAAVVLMLQGPGSAWLDDVSADGSDPGAGAQPQSVVLLKPQGPPKPKHSCDPAEGFYPDYPHAWRQVLTDQLRRAKEGPAPVVFLGDSLTQGWREQPHWQEHYAKLGAVNLGVGGDGTPQVLWRLDKGVLAGLKPRVGVLCIGINNVWPGFDAADTVKGIETVLARLMAQCPQAKVLLLGNTHFFDRGDGQSRQRVRAINAALAKLTDGRSVRFLDFSEQMLSEGDALKPELYAGDMLHLSAKGYDLWARAMDPVLDDMLAASVPAAKLQPFSWDWSRAHESVLDLSRFLDAPAGKGGFVRVQDGHFIKPDGARLRLWGVNIASTSCFPPKDQAPRIAEDLARLGFNIARFHHLDADWGQCLFISKTNHTRAFDTNNLDRLDFFIAELKQRGIYTSLTMNVHRHFKEGDGVRDWKILGIGKGATYFNPLLIELQHEFTRSLLTHRNPYTGLEYRHEPALVTIEMVNENSLLEAWTQARLVGRDDKAGDTWSPIPVSYGNELTEQFNAWLATNRTSGQVAAIRNEAKVVSDALIPRLAPNEFTNATALRFHTEAQFLMGVESNYFAGMKRLIRDELGSKSLLLSSGDHNDGFAGYAHLRNMLQFDVMDGHGYWQHPEIGKVTKIKNDPMVNDPLDSTFTQFARTPVAGRPFTISEVNHPFPHKFAAEGYMMLTAYALFHDWDGIVWFDWERGRTGDPKQGLPRNGWFDVSQDPVKLAQLTAAGLMWHRHDVAQTKEKLVRTYTPDETVEAMRLVQWQHRPFFKPGFELTTPLEHATRWRLDETHPPPDEVRPAKYPNPYAGKPPAELASDTGELRWLHADQKRGVITVATPRSQSLIGFVRGSGKSTPHLNADVTNEFCVLTLTALDEQPIASARKLLLVATTGTAQNTGQQFADDGKTLAEWGEGPIQIEPVTGCLNLRDLGGARAVHFQPLTAEGRPAGPRQTAAQLKTGWQLLLGVPPTTWWLVEVDR
jgi:lysophospholipase L1-like esterase